MDEALAALYEADSRHSLRGGSGASSPRVARWLGDIRRFFPSSVVQVMQKGRLRAPQPAQYAAPAGNARKRTARREPRVHAHVAAGHHPRKDQGNGPAGRPQGCGRAHEAA